MAQTRNGYILLEGGSEFSGRMAEPDIRAIELAGGFESPIAIIPTAAAPDNNHHRAGQNGLRWFHNLGSRNAAVVPLIDHGSARAYEVIEFLRQSRLIYLLGGFPGYLCETLVDSPSWKTILDVYHEGAIIAGSSAGAMVLCEKYFDPESGKIRDGLCLLPGTCLIPHHNQIGKKWANRLAAQLPDTLLIGIDEQTGMIDDGRDGLWNIYGAGSVTLYHHGKQQRFRREATIALSE